MTTIWSSNMPLPGTYEYELLFWKHRAFLRYSSLRRQHEAALAREEFSLSDGDKAAYIDELVSTITNGGADVYLREVPEPEQARREDGAEGGGDEELPDGWGVADCEGREALPPVR